ncbi:olfactory receptor 1J4-like [Sorex araneus]|uniref:olfactory receptor 1J4-like n=1 Tax=Sorex araneus TaxID=42254 RepID=UPI0024338ECB|nr:olfactory receptor 1J4-like [Sorex araneus]
MKRDNKTTVSEFLLLGLPIPTEHQDLFFTLFLVMYMATVLGNLLIILLIRMDSRLHTPMYFFLSHLALTDVSFSSVTVPKMLKDMQSIHKSIPYAGCMSQMYFFMWFGSVDNILLAVMAYDRYVAICQPLHYTTIMRHEKCVSLVTASWIYCSLRSLLHTLLLIRVMVPCNKSSVSEFLLMGLPIPPEHQGLFFTLFLVMYLATVLGNLLIILLIRMDSRLHTPMYFFLSHLAITDVSFSSVTVPKMLKDMQSIHKSISYAGCMSQMYFFIWFGSVDNLLLALMAYDRYVAICQPLHYATIMRQEKCVSLVSASWVYGSLRSLLHTLLLVRVSFCDDITIPHFFCELPVLLKMSCSDVSLNEWVLFFEVGIDAFLPFIAIVGSYIRIWATVLKDPSAKRFFKVLSTCGSHLLVVSLFYGSIAEVYVFSSPSMSSAKEIAASVMYMIVTPMLNPFIYSLRNRDIKQAFKLFVNRMKSCSSNNIT